MKTIQQAQSDKTGKSDISSRSGFTLLEVLIATALFGLVVVGTIEVYIMCNRLWHATSLNMQTVRASSLALSRMIYGMDTNNGLRAAAMMQLNTNVHGHWDGVKYWETATNKPPAAGNSAHYLCGWSGFGDGSWRLAYSNSYGGTRYIDYNAQERNILFLSASNAIVNRLLVCNYVSAARAVTNANGTLSLLLTVEKHDGMFKSSNTVSTLIKMRNKP